MRRSGSLLGLAVLLAACVGNIGDGNTVGSGGVPGPNAEDAAQIGVSGARRLTAVEYRTTVLDLVGVDVNDAELTLPTDERTPFDNDYTKQTASQALIDGADVLAAEVAEAVVADPSLRETIVPCTPSSSSDEACLRDFLASFGRRALRRPMGESEVDRFVEHFLPHAVTADDFWVAVDSSLRAFLQHPEFLYRIEIGDPVTGAAGMFRLNDFQIAARMSYLLWGSTPADWLLDDAQAGLLADAAQRREAAETMLEDPRAIDRIARFHAMWLAYEQLPHSADIADAMSQETVALLERYLLEERRPWSDLLLAEESYLNTALATHYGLPAPDGGEGWVAYADSGRRGILSHGTFLSAVPKFDDTSPTQRGLLIRTRLFCQEIHKPPPDLMVNTDEPPQAADPDACKIDRYFMSRTDGCKNCHALMDPVGFGLENYDSAGRYREFEPDRPDCPIDGVGVLEGVGEFTGPAQLGELMIQSGEIDSCVATMVYRFATGRYEIGEHDSALIDALVEGARGGGGVVFADLISELVGAEAFRYRREEVVQ